MEKQANDSSRQANLKPRERMENSNAIGCLPSSSEEPSSGRSLAERRKHDIEETIQGLKLQCLQIHALNKDIHQTLKVLDELFNQ
jgi:hypothetical protein